MSSASAGHGRIEGYDAGAMVLHWTIALAILFQLAVGFAMSRLDLFPTELRFVLFQWHKTIGIGILALTLARIAWRLLNPPPAHGPMPAAERWLAGLVHALFYVLMLIVPLSGWLLVSASPTKIPTLLMLSDRLPWPNLPLPAGLAGEAGAARAEAAHIWLAYSFVLLIGLHVAGALKHSIIDRAPSFSRMLPVGRLTHQSAALVALPVAAALVALFLSGGVYVARSGGTATASAVALEPAGSASGWTIDKAASKLSYSVTFSGKTIPGAVANWDAAVTFDPANLSGASATVVVDAASVSIEDAFIRSNLTGPDGLDVAAFPKAELRLNRFSKTETGFLGEGKLRIKTIEAPVRVAFTFAEGTDGTADVTGSTEIDRMAYKLGEQNDSKGEWLAPTIKIDFALKAKRS